MTNSVDVAIIGAGVTGCSIARALSRYQLSVAVIDKEADVSFGTSKANSGIIHGGFHSSFKYLKARLELQGNMMFDQLQDELGFPFKRTGIIVVAFTEEDLITIETLYNQGVENKVPGIEICSRERLLELEPKLNPDVIGGLHAPGGGIIEPYRFVFALAESAQKNGVTFIQNFKVTGAQHKEGRYHIQAANGQTITATTVINAAGVYADAISKIFGGEDYSIIPRKGEEYLLDRDSKAYPRKVIFPVPSPNSKGMLIIPTTEGTMMVGPTALEIDDKEDFTTTAANLDLVFNSGRRLIPTISERDIITSFAGLRPVLPSGDFMIEASKKIPHFIHVAGIQSPGLTAAPAIGEYVKNLVKELGVPLCEKQHYDPTIPKVPRIRHLSPEEVDALVQENPQYGNLICRCESVSEAEIVEAIKRGHTTLDGIKFYTRTGMGRCQGGFCSYKIMKILMRETGMSLNQISKRGASSTLLQREL